MYRIFVSMVLSFLVCQSASAQDKTLASLFPWRDSIHQRLQNLEGNKQAPQNDALIQTLRDQIVQLNAQIAALMAKQSQPAPQQQPIILLMPNPNTPQIIPNPGTPQIIPNPGTPQIIPNPGTPQIIPNPGTPQVQPNPGTPQINPNPGVPRVNPNPGTPQINGQAPPPTGYQTYTDRPPVLRLPPPPSMSSPHAQQYPYRVGNVVYDWYPSR